MNPLVVLVTGASAGFGAAIARRCVADGHRVIAAARRGDRLDALGSGLGDALLPLTLDVTDGAAVAALPACLPDGWREVDVLVNNAGLALGLTSAQAASLPNWETMVETNVTGLMRVTHALLPGMVARDRGQIINIGSVAGTYSYAGGNVYGATKAFVAQFSLNLKADLIGTRVRVTNIEPGMVGGTEFSLVRHGGDETRARAHYEGAEPLTADDIAEAVAWVMSLPEHVNINRMEMMPACQAPGGPVVKRR